MCQLVALKVLSSAHQGLFGTLPAPRCGEQFPGEAKEAATLSANQTHPML